MDILNKLGFRNGLRLCLENELINKVYEQFPPKLVEVLKGIEG
jgi:hypothetical protein